MDYRKFGIFHSIFLQEESSTFLMQYKTRNKAILIENLELQITIVTNVDELMDHLLAKGEDHQDVKDERIPYWADLWPSAIALSRYLLLNKIIRPGRKVLEIGCGLGLPGIVAGKLGANVVLSDYLPEALDFARKNWMQNMNGRNVRLEIMDWRRPRPDLTADLILASDVAYETRNFDHLPGAFKTLCRQGGELILAEPGRDIARPFLQKLLLEGFSKKHTLIKGQYDNLDYQVNIYHFKPETRDPDSHSS